MRTAMTARMAARASRNQRPMPAILCETRSDAGPSTTVRARARSDSRIRARPARLLHGGDRPQPARAGRLLLLPLVREPAGRQPGLHRSVLARVLGNDLGHCDAPSAVAVPALGGLVVRRSGRAVWRTG